LQQWFRHGVWRQEISSGTYRPLPIKTRVKFEKVARAIRPHLAFRDLIQLCIHRPNTVGNLLRKNGFAETTVNLSEELTSQIEKAVSDFQDVLFNRRSVDTMPDSWRREFAKTNGQPLRHVPIENRPELLSAVYELLADRSIYLSSYLYFRARPILKNIRILYSQNSGLSNLESQQFHRDPEGSRQVKIFIAVGDVSMESGPLTVVSREDSERVVSNDGEHV